jgi:hypothetical protein
MPSSVKISTCGLLLSLALMVLTFFAEARKPQPPLPSSVDIRAAFERLCATLGSLAFEQATARDRGVAQEALAAIVRQVLDPALIPGALATLRAIYATPTLTPASAQYQTERVCAQRVEGTVQAQ